MPHPFSVAWTWYKTNKAKAIVVFLKADFLLIIHWKSLICSIGSVEEAFKAASKCGNNLDKNQSHYVHEVNHFKSHWGKKNTLKQI